LGLIARPTFLLAEKWLSKFKWLSDPVGLSPGHIKEGLLGLSMTAFLTQQPFGSAAGSSNLPNGLLLGSGYLALQQPSEELLAVAVVLDISLAKHFRHVDSS